jgi:SAM-dependent methyltransferase
MPERVLDIGCGYGKTPGAIGMDSLRASDADVIADLAQRWPFADASFDKVVASHVLEHVPEVVHVMQEAYRVLRPNGRFLIKGPHFSSPNLVWSDPTHRRALSIGMFQHFRPDTIHPYSNARFRVARAKLRCAGTPLPGRRRWFRKPLDRALRAFELWVNSDSSQQLRAERMYFRLVPFYEVEVELEAI